MIGLKLGGSMLVFAAFSSAQPAFAQDQGAGKPDQSADVRDAGPGVEEIVVTARLRSETLQDTPMSVGVATAQALEAAHVTSALDLKNVVPGLILERAPAALNTAVTLRGLGSSPGAGATESSVGFFINGVYLPRSRDFTTALFDADHVEVVRGTQGSLLGKNTSLGAVNLVTKAPGHKLEGNASLSHELNFDSWTVTGGMSIPLSDTLAVRVAGIYDDQGGWAKNILTKEKGGATTRKAGRITFAWTPSSDFDATLLYEHQEVQLRGLTAEIAAANGAVTARLAAAGYPTLPVVFDRHTFDTDTRVPHGYVENANVDRVSLTAHWNFGDYVLTSQSAYSDSTGDNDIGPDYLPGDFFRITTFANDGSSFSQELRLTSPGDKPFRYVVGGWYGRNKVNQVSEWNLNYPGLGLNDFINALAQKTRSWSAFAQADFDILENLTLSGGARYTREKKKAILGRETVTPGIFTAFVYPAYTPFLQTRSEGALDGLVNLSYKATDNLMVYTAWAQGTKSGGYADNVGLLDQSRFEPERARTAELGVRYQSPDRSLTVNATVFSTRVKDYQLVLFNGATFAVSNTQLKSNGIEHQIIWRPAFIPGFKIDWSNTYAKAKDRVARTDIPNAPRWSGGLSFSYETPISDGFKLNLGGGVSYESSQIRGDNAAGVPRASAIKKYDASIGIVTDAGIAIRFFGRNLTNANRATFAFPTPFSGPGSYTAVSEQPRTLSLEASYKF